ncbi:hypothetical protein SUDANB180_02016 [Streptomyces sp. enrichment culture]
MTHIPGKRLPRPGAVLAATSHRPHTPCPRTNQQKRADQ